MTQALDFGPEFFDKFGVSFEKGDIIFCEYEPGTNFYFILEGRVKISKILSDKEKILDILEPGEVFGEMAYLLNEKRMATAISETPSILLIIPADIFEELLQVNQPFARDIIQQLSNRLRKIHLPEKP